MRPNVRTNDVTRLCLLTNVNYEYYSQITSGHHFRVCAYMNSNVITLWSNQCMPHSHAILYWNNNKTHPSVVHSRETINTGPTLPTEVSAAINPLKRNKAPGNDNITTEDVKDGGEPIGQMFTNMFNRCELPNSWKARHTDQCLH